MLFMPPDFVPLLVTQNDLLIASMALGFTIGFGFLTTWKAMRQTSQIYGRYGNSRLNSPYVWMIWLEILVCLAFAIICILHLVAVIPPSFIFFFSILTLWALQVQFLLQIIINRVSLLMPDRSKATRLKIGVAVLITSINISVYCIWIPARLQTSATYEQINNWWDRCEKVLYLIVDAVLNWYFIRTVQVRLVSKGLKKYEPLVTFNCWIILFSLAMDVLIISMMSLNNSFVYMQFHPLAYIVKLNIEMSLADLIARVTKSANSPNGVASSGAYHSSAAQRTQGTVNDTKNHRHSMKPESSAKPAGRVDMDGDGPWSSESGGNSNFENEGKQNAESAYSFSSSEEAVNAVELNDMTRSSNNGITVKTTREVVVSVANVDGKGRIKEEDETPLTEADRAATAAGVQKGMGVFTKVWGEQ